jgi:hypothetical protein
MTDPIATIEETLRWYAETPTTDGLVPAGPNPRLLADSGDRARLALVALAELELDIACRNSELLQEIRELMKLKKIPWLSIPDDGLYRGV